MEPEQTTPVVKTPEPEEVTIIISLLMQSASIHILTFNTFFSTHWYCLMVGLLHRLGVKAWRNFRIEFVRGTYAACIISFIFSYPKHRFKRSLIFYKTNYRIPLFIPLNDQVQMLFGIDKTFQP